MTSISSWEPLKASVAAAWAMEQVPERLWLR